MGTRTPVIKEKLEAAGFTLSSSINSDEAAAIGASYKAADLSSAFRVKPFAIKNAIPYQIQVEFDRTITDDEGNEKMKHSKRVLFAPGNSYPQKKVLTFNKYSDDFSFEINYGDNSEYTHLTNDVDYFNLGKFSDINVPGVSSALEDHKEATPQGIKVHFEMNDSGLFSFKKVEHLFENQKLIVETKKDDKKDDKDSKAEADAIFSKLNLEPNMNFDKLDPETLKKLQETMKDFPVDPEKVKVVNAGELPDLDKENEQSADEKKNTDDEKKEDETPQAEVKKEEEKMEEKSEEKPDSAQKEEKTEEKTEEKIEEKKEKTAEKTEEKDPKNKKKKKKKKK